MEQIFSAIPTVLQGIESPAEVDKAIVFAAWCRCSGELIRERTVPVEFVRNRLTIAVQDKTWRRHLEDLSSQMLVLMNGVLGQGTVKFIEFSIDESAVNAVRKTSNEPNVDEESCPDVAPSLRHAANAIADDDLRNQFLSSAASYLAKQ